MDLDALGVFIVPSPKVDPKRYIGIPLASLFDFFVSLSALLSSILIHALLPPFPTVLVV